MIWHPKSSAKFSTTFPLADSYAPRNFKNGDEPITAVCCSYAVLADGQGLVAMPKGTRAFHKVMCWHKPCELESAAEARAVIGRAPLTREWFSVRGWLREEVPCA